MLYNELPRNAMSFRGEAPLTHNPIVGTDVPGGPPIECAAGTDYIHLR